MIRSCIRLCAIAALRHAGTLAGMKVFDSDNSPLLEALKENEDSPYITVYTDDDTRMDIRGKDLATSTRTLLLILEIGVASKVTKPGSDPTLEMPATDEGMELSIDALEFQAIRALWQDVDNPWGDLLRSMVLGIRRVPSIRGAMAAEGVRYAARQIAFHLGDVVADPAPGYVPDATTPIRQFLDAAKADTTVAISTAATFVDSFLDVTAKPDWRQAQAWLGLTQQGIRGSGEGPLVATDPDQAGALLPAPADDADPGTIHVVQDDNL